MFNTVSFEHHDGVISATTRSQFNLESFMDHCILFLYYKDDENG